MKKFLVICFLILIGLPLCAQNYNYGLAQHDLNLLLGQYVTRADLATHRWVTRTFSWGRQSAVDTNDLVIHIDYNNIAARLGRKYEKYLVIDDTSIPFVITKIEKRTTNQYVLTLVFVSNPDSPKDAGQITITFLDDLHIVIDNTKCVAGGVFNYLALWKSAGPLITVRSKQNFIDLPDFKEQ
jgi:hypothetical protein